MRPGPNRPSLFWGASCEGGEKKKKEKASGIFLKTVGKGGKAGKAHPGTGTPKKEKSVVPKGKSSQRET